MANEIIRKDDRTSHGGTVLEGSAFDICHGKPIAYMGHKTYCPKCKGDFPIVEGVVSMTFYGAGVALAGMKTSCGAVLIPSQFTDTVEWGSAFVASSSNSIGFKTSTVARGESERLESHQNAEVKGLLIDENSAYDLVFHVKHEETGEGMSDMPYKITLSDAREFIGTTDNNGFTEKIHSHSAQIAKIEVPYYDDDCATHSAGKSDACGC